MAKKYSRSKQYRATFKAETGALRHGLPQGGSAPYEKGKEYEVGGDLLQAYPDFFEGAKAVKGGAAKPAQDKEQGPADGAADTEGGES